MGSAEFEVYVLKRGHQHHVQKGVQTGSAEFEVYVALDLKTTTMTRTSFIALKYNVFCFLENNGADSDCLLIYEIALILSVYISLHQLLLSVHNGM